MGYYVKYKTKFLNPEICFLASAGRPDRSTELGVGRPTCTNVHASLAGGPVDRSDRPSRELCSLESPGRPGQSTGRELCSLFQARVDRGSNDQISDRWRSTGPVDRQPSGL